MRPSTIIAATVALLVGDHARAAAPESLPGSALSVGRAKHEARYIVVAKIGRTGDVLSVTAGQPAFQMWTELKPSAVLKGKISEQELNKLPLPIRIEGTERFPRSGEEFVFFIDSELRNGAIIKVLAKTKEDLAAIEAAPPEPPADSTETHLGRGIGGNLGGGIGGGLDGRLSSPQPSPRPSGRGTRIAPGEGATGRLLKVQNEFAAAMQRDDPKPEDRQAHFAWLEKNEYVRRYGVQQIGWSGAILACEPRPGGGWLITVKIAPRLYATRGLRHTVVLDSVEETYEFIGGRIRLVASNAAIAKPNRQGFPVAW